MLRLVWTFCLFKLLALRIFACGVLKANNIYQEVPPKGKYGVNHDAFEKTEGSTAFDESTDEGNGYVWERSGLFQGDIMTFKSSQRNGIIGEQFRWPNATVPFYIEEDQFNVQDIETILSAIREFETKTCVRFRPYSKSDENWVFITSNETGCWSFVGNLREGGQQLNLQSPGCVYKGTVMHEMLHACGFLHEQSTYNRDNYVKILTENIEDKHRNNFLRYNDTILTDFNTTYDYDSIMHYSAYAFSKNGKPTIKATRENRTTLGQRNGFTDIDATKLNRMYQETCNQPSRQKGTENMNVMDWFRQMFPQ